MIPAQGTLCDTASRPVYGHFMHDLEIFDFEGRQEVSSAEQLQLALSRRFDGGNHFEIAAFGRTYPMLDLMVSGRPRCRPLLCRRGQRWRTVDRRPRTRCGDRRVP